MIKVLFRICTLIWSVNNYISCQNESTIHISSRRMSRAGGWGGGGGVEDPMYQDRL